MRRTRQVPDRVRDDEPRVAAIFPVLQSLPCFIWLGSSQPKEPQMATSPKLPAPGEDQPGSPEPSVPQFEPVPLRLRHDGWTADRQIAFIERDSLRSRRGARRQPRCNRVRARAAPPETHTRARAHAHTCVRARAHMSLPPLATFSPTYRAEGSDCAAIVSFCRKEREGRPAGPAQPNPTDITNLLRTAPRQLCSAVENVPLLFSTNKSDTKRFPPGGTRPLLIDA